MLGEKAEQTRPEIAQILFKHNDKKIKDKELNRVLYETRRIIESKALSNSLTIFIYALLVLNLLFIKGCFS